MKTGVNTPAHARFAAGRRTAAVPVWAPTETAEAPGSGVVGRAGAGDERSDRAGGASDLPGAGSRISKRQRSGLLVALLAFYCLQLAAAFVAWWQAPIRTEALVNPMIAYGICVALMIPALSLRGRWRTIPALVATVLGTMVPLWLTRHLMEIVGPRDVWVGQSLTLQVFFPLVVGIGSMVAVLTAPRPVAAHLDS